MNNFSQLHGTKSLTYYNWMNITEFFSAAGKEIYLMRIGYIMANNEQLIKVKSNNRPLKYK